MGPAPGIRALAAAAPAGLLQRAGWSDPLLLAGEIGWAAAAALWGDSDAPARVQIARMAGPEAFGGGPPGQTGARRELSRDGQGAIPRPSGSASFRARLGMGARRYSCFV